MPPASIPARFPEPGAAFTARAILLGERLDLRSWSAADALATNPLTVSVRGGGAAVLYRFGVVVFFGVSAAEEASFLRQLEPCVVNRDPAPGTETLAVRVEADRSGRIRSRSAGLQKMIGSMLLVESRMVGRAAISDKPEILWDHPELEALFAKVEDEFEIRLRDAALERKLNLIAHTAQTVAQMLTAKHSLRVEWYIVILIVVEILLTLYELFLH